jgi:two-component system, NarL family, sensor histidine kinase DesK
MPVWQWWREQSRAERLDLLTRWPLLLVYVAEPPLALLFVVGEPNVRAPGAVAFLMLAVLHAVACLILLRSGFAHAAGGPRPGARLITAAAALALAGVAAGAAAFPAYLSPVPQEAQPGLPVGVTVVALFGTALTVALTPLLRTPQLVFGVGIPTAALAVLQASIDSPANQPSWAVLYASTAGLAALTYRSSVWSLGVIWEIDRSRDVQARLAVAEERLRFARDLHDVLGRNLALIAVKSELAAQLARRGQDGAVEHMLDVRQVAQDSMREVREVVGGYRGADLDTELTGARSVLAAAGISARVIGDGAGLSRAVQAALGWVVREATTNVIRHSDATTTRIQVDRVPVAGRETAVLRIENDGVRDAGSTPSNGSGLVGLRERLADLGGEVTASQLAGRRFVVEARLPMTRPALPTGEPAR